MRRHRFAFLVMAGLGLLLVGCASHRIAMVPSSQTFHDVFTCKGLTADNRWVGVTDVFDPVTDPRVVVVATLSGEDKEKTLHYELVNPLETIVQKEEVVYPREKILGIYFEIPRLMRLGGKGKWQANVYSDGEFLGQAIFFLGEKTEEDKSGGRHYYVVGAEAEEEADPLKDGAREFDTYIREVTPELEIPAAEADIVPQTLDEASPASPVTETPAEPEGQ